MSEMSEMIPTTEVIDVSQIIDRLDATLEECEVTSVHDYPSPRDVDPLAYPGKRPEWSFVNDGEDVLPMAVEYDPQSKVFVGRVKLQDGSIQDVDDWLEERDHWKLSELTPVVGFGSNASPGQIHAKFGKFEDASEFGIVPTVMGGTMRDTDIFFNRKTNDAGYAFAVADSSEHTEGVHSPVAINFLTPEQLALMDATEPNYRRTTFSVVTLPGGLEMDALLYVGEGSIYLDQENNPVALAEIPASNRKTRAMTQAEFQTDELAVALGSIGVTFELRQGFHRDKEGSLVDQRLIEVGRAQATSMQNDPRRIEADQHFDTMRTFGDHLEHGGQEAYGPPRFIEMLHERMPPEAAKKSADFLAKVVTPRQIEQPPYHPDRQ